MRNETVQTSRFLSYILRHRPESIGLELDSGGWADVGELIAKANQSGRNHVTRDAIEEAVAHNNKNRFSFNRDKSRIRANQGHSIAVDLGLQPLAPPGTLFHGTATRFLDSIFQAGLESRNRQHVHLSADSETAITVGQRHGSPIVLLVDAAKMHSDGYAFFRSENGVWLTDHVPLAYLTRST